MEHSFIGLPFNGKEILLYLVPSYYFYILSVLDYLVLGLWWWYGTHLRASHAPGLGRDNSDQYEAEEKRETKRRASKGMVKGEERMLLRLR